MPPVADTQAARNLPALNARRHSKPFVLRTSPGRLRADGNSVEAKRWQDACEDLLASLVPGRTILDLTPEARTLVEQVCDLTLQSDLLRAALLRGEDVDVDRTVRVSITTDRHLATLRKIRLLREGAPKAPKAAAAPQAPREHWTRRVHEVARDILTKRDGHVGDREARDLADRLVENVLLPVRATHVPADWPDDWLDAFVPALRERPDLLARLYARNTPDGKVLEVDVRAPHVQLLIRELLAGKGRRMTTPMTVGHVPDPATTPQPPAPDRAPHPGG